MFANPNTSSLGKIGLGLVEGTYLYFSDVRDEFVDRLTLQVKVHGIKLLR
jgi:hypothetical protein